MRYRLDMVTYESPLISGFRSSSVPTPTSESSCTRRRIGRLLTVDNTATTDAETDTFVIAKQIVDEISCVSQYSVATLRLGHAEILDIEANETVFD